MKIWIGSCLMSLLLLSAGPSGAEVQLKTAQSLYVPAYAHVFMGPKGSLFNLSVTLVIRNTDPDDPVTVTLADYYDSSGRKTKSFIQAPVTLPPMASTHFLINESEASGGIGANFIVRWRSDKPVNAPIAECVMIGGRKGQGISFVAPGLEITE